MSNPAQLAGSKKKKIVVITANSIYIIYQMKSLQQVYDSFPCSGCLCDGRNHPEPCYGAGGEHLRCSPKTLRLGYGRWTDKWRMSSALLDAHPNSVTCVGGGCVLRPGEQSLAQVPAASLNNQGELCRNCNWKEISNIGGFKQCDPCCHLPGCMCM